MTKEQVIEIKKLLAKARKYTNRARVCNLKAATALKGC